MVTRIVLVAGLLLGTTILAAAGDQDVDAMEVQSAQALAREDYAAALPLLQELANLLRDDPQRLEAVEERIRVAKHNLNRKKELQQDRATGNGDAELPGSPGGSEPPTAEARKAHPAPEEGEVRELTILQLGNFVYDGDKGGNIPEDVQALSGSAVRIRGFMIPMDSATRITQFALVPDLFACCFGQPPQIHHTIVVSTPAGKTVGYFDDEIVVEGVLKVEEKWEDDWIVSVFEMEAASVKPAPR